MTRLLGSRTRQGTKVHLLCSWRFCRRSRASSRRNLAHINVVQLFLTWDFTWKLWYSRKVSKSNWEVQYRNRYSLWPNCVIIGKGLNDTQILNGCWPIVSLSGWSASWCRSGTETIGRLRITPHLRWSFAKRCDITWLAQHLFLIRWANAHQHAKSTLSFPLSPEHLG